MDLQRNIWTESDGFYKEIFEHFSNIQEELDAHSTLIKVFHLNEWENLK